ncbi:Trp biosynthesis-associated membrane protein [Cellulomonas sp. P22]|uniref:Trp biosynthesis-associated membrane protein n=1 Tax=Cellulomonas sp. P22 TaxID=3373189 RepID=UPI0037A6B1DC
MTTAPSQVASRGSSSRGGGRGRVALLLALLAGLTALGAVPVWLRTQGTSALEGQVPVDVTGTQAAPGVIAAAVVLLAAAAAVGLVGRIGRWVVVGVVAAAGGVVVWSTLDVVSAPEPAAEVVAAAVTGVGALAAPVTLTAWPWVVLAIGLVDLLAAGVVVRSSRRWPRPTRRHTTVAAGAGAGAETALPGPDDDQAAWDALTRGDDPT